ncbi:TIGR04283 family arsenosugar biosynthesis glycosyltransferase [Celeribacter sp.]|uniref:TIGR04283 family arsenosugar biosynthesis glycosyltransferase n=1 Tax=Celeribacter sp. TaxID=1890673 RepID=UPI003A95401B
MRAPISVIIPTLDAAPQLAETLTRVMEGVDAGVVRELIVSDGGSSDDIARLADAIGAELIVGAAGRGGQLARGAEAAQGAWLLFLHADTWLPEGWSDVALAHLADPDRALVFSLSFRGGGAMARLTGGWARLRTRLFGLPYGDQALLVSRALYDQTGGYADIPLMEDVDLARRLGRARIVLSSCAVQTDPSRYQERGWLIQGGRNLWRLLRYLAGADPVRLSRSYRR